MALTCNGCGKDIVTPNHMKCSKCADLYDLQCLNFTYVNFSKLTDGYKKQWLCPRCTCSKPKIGDSNTPIRTINHSLTSDNVNKTRGSRGKTGQGEVDVDSEPTTLALLGEIRMLRQDILEVKTQLTSVSSSLTQKIEEYEKRLTDKDQEIKRLSATLSNLQIHIDSQDQLHLSNELEIVGMPEQNNENLTHLVLLTSNKLGIKLDEADIDHIQRAGPKRDPLPPTAASRPIVVKLLRKVKRDEILLAAKARKGLTSSDIVSGTSSTLYFNERLSKSNRALFGEARKRAHQYKFQFCWVRNGSIFVRKSANTTDQKFRAQAIRSHEDIDLLIGPATSDYENTATSRSERFRLPNNSSA